VKNDGKASSGLSLLLVLCVLTTAANVYLMRANKKLRSNATAIAIQVSVGRTIPSVSGVDLTNIPISVSTAGKKATVLMVYSPTCPFCEANWHSWTSIIARTTDPKVGFAAIDLTSKASSSFLSSKKTGRALLIHQMDPNQVVELNLSLTPMTILIGGDSKVARTWTGVLTANDIEELTKFLS